MKVAVIGGLGFIGSHIVDILISNNHEVAIYDDCSTGTMDNLNKKASLFIGDILQYSDLNSFFERTKPDVVCHHAAQIDVQTSLKEPRKDASINIMGTINVLEMCVRHKVKRIVYASSAAIYGNPKYLGVDEKHEKNPESFYGLSKEIPERYIKMYAKSHNISYGILRYANVYGPRQKAKGEGGVVSIFTNKMKNNEECYIYGNGEQTRDFVFVKDIALANLLAIEKNDNFTVNISTALEVSVNELFNIMKKVYNYKKEVNYLPAREGDILKSYLTNDLAKIKLNFTYYYSLIKGIKEMAKLDA
ncbi:MAG: NAD-dependent epimerase/dehydratase family protein [Clostridiales bacterium]|nr:NAD-dependent epimerase/dehydratase family protein [Clostridiales bacterium]